MAKYTYKALNQQGNETSGTLEAGSENEARSALRAKALYVLKIHVGGEKKSVMVVAKIVLSYLSIKRYKKANTADLVLFFRQIALMLRAGNTLIQAIEAISQMTVKVRFKNALVRILVSIQGGSSFAKAIEKESTMFPPIVSRLVASGEASGELQTILERLAINLGRSADIKRQFIAAMIYPTIVTIVAFGVITFLAMSVVPKFAKMLEGKSSQLPAATQAMMDGSAYMVDNGTIIFSTLGITIFLILAAYTTEKGKTIIDKVLIRTPLIGSAIQSSAMAQTGMTMALLLRSGLTVLETLKVIAHIMPNKSMSACFGLAGEKILSGQSLSVGLNQPLIPHMVQHMAGIGEKSGELDHVMDELGNYFQSQTEARLKAMIAMIEPAMTLLIGGLVGFVYYAFFKAMMQVSAGG
ncbi:MAG: type II secretion system F family protein [Litorilituus sp.]|jgi:type IV pilus assembly protein PilC|nr:type II secretion system F family protein [Litorilituus sp.]